MAIHPGMKVAIQNIEKDGIIYRPCSLCKELLTLDKFGKNLNARNGSGLMYCCKTCHAKRRSDYYKNKVVGQFELSLIVEKIEF